jgi:hypothetical protein
MTFPDKVDISSFGAAVVGFPDLRLQIHAVVTFLTLSWLA